MIKSATISSVCVCILTVAAMAWQNDEPPPAIEKDGVVNAASQMPPLFGGGALAPGSVVRIRGWRLGPSVRISATAPLPTRLGGIGIEVRQNQTRVPAVLLSVSANEIEAILPQAAPLGDAQIVILRDGAASDPSPVHIVKSSFGTSISFGQGWGQEGLVHNGWPPEDMPLNTRMNSARPGQTVTLRGTGLGAATTVDGAEAHRLPVTVTGLTIQVGGKPVKTIRFAGRSACCTGYDELAFDLPADTPEGCHVPVQVRTAPGIAGNFVTLAVQREGGQCSDPGDWVSPQTAVFKRAGLVILHHSDMLFALTSSGMMRYRVDAGFAKFLIDPSPQLAMGFPPPGTCTATERITKLKNMLGALSPLDSIAGTPADAGPTITVEGNGERRTIGHAKDSLAAYSAVLGGNAPIPSRSSFPLFLRPGAYHISAKGEGTGVVQAEIPVGSSVEWTNRSGISQVDRAKGVTLHWKPAQRDDLMLLVAQNVDDDSGSLGMAICLAHANTGRFTIPPDALTNIPPTKAGEQLPLNLLWVIEVPGQAPMPVTTGLLDRAMAFFTSSSVRTVKFQ